MFLIHLFLFQLHKFSLLFLQFLLSESLCLNQFPELHHFYLTQQTDVATIEPSSPAGTNITVKLKDPREGDYHIPVIVFNNESSELETIILDITYKEKKVKKEDDSEEKKPPPDPNASSNSNKLIPTVIGLAGAVVGLSGFIMSEQKVRNFLSGLGGLGIVGTIAALVKRNAIDADKRQDGWQNGWGKWIVGAGSVLIGGIPFLSTENKKSASAAVIGFGAVGAVLAYCFEPVRNVLGLPALPKSDIPAEQT